MTPELRSELLKQRSTGTNLGLLAALLGLVVLAVLLHGLGLSVRTVDTSSEQLSVVFGWGERLGVVFAGLLGALSVTSEIRHGTIRPTFLVTPKRTRVLTAKAVASMSFGAGLGLIATAVAAGAGSAALATREIDAQLDVSDYALFLAGGAAAAALWAVIGVGLGAVVRNQVPTLIGICVWLLLVEGLLVGDVAGVGDVGQFAPGAAAAALSGQDPDTLLAPAAAIAVLALYAFAAAVAGAVATARRDVP